MCRFLFYNYPASLNRSIHTNISKYSEGPSIGTFCVLFLEHWHTRTSAQKIHEKNIHILYLCVCVCVSTTSGFGSGNSVTKKEWKTVEALHVNEPEKKHIREGGKGSNNKKKWPNDSMHARVWCVLARCVCIYIYNQGAIIEHHQWE